ncbi:hypothetical protein CTEN210_12426 [Chaetoceros tenuissimus]|uniref:Neurochondrin family protein n=1 Tax=Chaetoceros tenuissimus TaxID=426638 RepID=A0AAD3D3D4_9STRA|nr:hypothetical protein CTEN210_12426 [Chaetoceros tenuissimus]
MSKLGVKELEENIKILLREPNPHNNERYLACCALLLRINSPSLVSSTLNNNSQLQAFVLNIISDGNVSIEMKRVAIRILSISINDDHEWISEKDWNNVIEFFTKRCQESYGLDYIDIEILNLLAAMLQVELDTSSCKVKMASKCCELPMQCLKRLDCEVVTSVSRTGNNGVDDFFIKILNHDYENDQGLQQQFKNSTVNFFSIFATISLATNVSPILSNDFIIQMTKILFETNREKDNKRISIEQQYLLHFSVLVFALKSVSGINSANKKEFDLIAALKQSAPNQELVNAIQKLILSGITSLLQSNETDAKDDNETKNSNQPSMQRVITMIRTMTIQLLTELLESCGTNWMRSSSNNSSSLGSCASFCMMTRLVAGELRIDLGKLVDCSLYQRDPDVKKKPISKEIIDDDIDTRIESCIRVALFILKVMLDIADENDQSLHFNNDAILHVRHTMEDFLDSSVQFLLEEVNMQVLEGWPRCAYECCRYLGAYLAQINVFDYDVEQSEMYERGLQYESTVKKHGGIDNDQDHKQITTVDLLRAVNNSVDLVSNPAFRRKESSKRDTDEGMKSVVMFPCILSILTCCEEDPTGRHANLVKEHLFRNTKVSSLIENTLLVSRGKDESENLILSIISNLDNVSWCCLLIRAMIDFESLIKFKGKLVDKDNLSSAIVSTAEIYVKVMNSTILQRGESGLEDVVGQLLECWYLLDGPQRSNESETRMMTDIVRGKGE